MMVFPGAIRPQALIFARFPRTLRPTTPRWNPASSAHDCTLRARPLTSSLWVESGLKRSFCTLPAHPLTPNPHTPSDPNPRVESGLKRSFLPPPRAPSDPQATHPPTPQNAVKNKVLKQNGSRNVQTHCEL